MKKKDIQLGMPHGTASGQLRKKILFSLLEETNKNICFQCGNKIEKESDLSIEHKEPWLDSENPTKKFFDLDNIAFSHLSCNSGAARQTRIRNHGLTLYGEGCRCEVCVQAKKDSWKKYKMVR